MTASASPTTVRIAATAIVDPSARIGDGCQVWHHSQIRDGVVLGDGCIVGKDVYIDSGVRVGRNGKIQNGALLYHGLTVGDGVFIGPQACFTNDRVPRAVNPDLSLKAADDWVVGSTSVGDGAAIGAGAVVVTGASIGRWAIVGAGSVVTRDVEAFALVVGNPARRIGWVCKCGDRLDDVRDRCWGCGVALVDGVPTEDAAGPPPGAGR